MAKNPFTPTFGRVPAHFAGRAGILSAMERALDNGPDDPNLTSILVGPRGTGKTALLASVAREASARGWVTARVSAGEGMLEDVIERAWESASHLVAKESGTRLKSLSVGQGVAVEFERADAPRGNWRTQMNGLLDRLAELEVGLLITVDEVRPDVEEMRRLAAVYQHFVGEDRNVALVMAGLPSNVAQLVSDESVSFLRRARQHHLGRVDDADIEIAFRRTLADAGAQIDDDAVAVAVSAIEGYPYMLQLVGYWTWEQADGAPIRAEHVARGTRQALQELTDGVLAATYRELSRGDVRFLEAMVSCEQPASLANISAKMGVKSNYASKYKERLLVAGVLGEAGQGHYSIDLPGFRQYVERRIG